MTKTKRQKKKPSAPDQRNLAHLMIFWMSATLLVVVPLTFDVSVYRIYVLPRFAVLLCGAAALGLSLVLAASQSAQRSEKPRIEKLSKLFGSRQVRIVFLFLVWISLSTAFSVAPLVSLCGSVYNQMGLLTYLCFFICFLGLIVGIGESLPRLRRLLWVVAISGLLVAIYAGLQFFGVDPFVPGSIYAFNSESGLVARSVSTLGHYNSLGNFLLYTTPVTAAIALAARGWRRWVMLAALAIAVAGIAFSGTRGAWVGLVAGAATFGATQFRFRHSASSIGRALWTRKLLIVLVALAALIGAVTLSPASRGIAVRARSFVSDGLTGSGRTLLWRDSLRMVPAFPIIGCGPEGFRKAFPAYRSRDLARLSPQANDESSHNAYLDAAISYGLPGLMIYLAMLACAFRLLLATRRAAVDPDLRLFVTAILSSLVAVLVHNFFIYDQISTGLYFFGFLALAQVVTNVASHRNENDPRNTSSKEARTGAEPVRSSTLKLPFSNSILELVSRLRPAARRARKASSPRLFPGAGFLAPLGVSGAAVLVVASVWYSASLLGSDAQIKEVVDSARALDLDAMAYHGERAAGGLEPTGQYDFLFASLLSQFAITAGERPQHGDRTLTAVRSRALELATPHIEKALAHTTTPELDCLVLAYLALAAGDPARSRAWSGQAIYWDPNSFEGHWLMAESLLALGDRQLAADEAEAALDLNPSSPDARSALSRATGQDRTDAQSAAALIERFRRLAKAGKMTRALQVLERAINGSDGKCPDCHSALASFYEETGQPDKASAERLIAVQESADPASSERLGDHRDAPVGKTRSTARP